jgi:hypothetical protein
MTGGRTGDSSQWSLLLRGWHWLVGAIPYAAAVVVAWNLDSGPAQAWVLGLSGAYLISFFLVVLPAWNRRRDT